MMGMGGVWGCVLRPTCVLLEQVGAVLCFVCADVRSMLMTSSHWQAKAEVNKYVNVGQLKTLFQVNTAYVGTKLRRILFPFMPGK